jgi:hypothetical protein
VLVNQNNVKYVPYKNKNPAEHVKNKDQQINVPITYERTHERVNRALAYKQRSLMKKQFEINASVEQP